MALTNQTILSILIIILSSVLISETESAGRPFNCYFCEAAALGHLRSGPELQVWNFSYGTKYKFQIIFFVQVFISLNGNNNIIQYTYLQRCEFEDFIEINKQQSKFHLTYDKYEPLRHSKLERYKICQKVSGYDEFGMKIFSSFGLYLVPFNISW